MVRELLRAHSDYVCEAEPFKGAVIFDIEDGNAEMFFSGDYNIELYRKMRSVARKNIKNYDQDFYMDS